MPFRITTFLFGIIFVVVGVWFGYYVLVQKGIISVPQTYDTSINALVRSGKTLTCVTSANTFEGVGTITAYITNTTANVRIDAQQASMKVTELYFIDLTNTYNWQPGAGTGTVVAYSGSPTSESGNDPAAHAWGDTGQFNCTTGLPAGTGVALPSDVNFKPPTI